jgi:DnaJ-domain-containing protein 1
MWKILLIIAAILYVLNPYDLFPDLFPGWGWLDDMVIVGLVVRYFYLQKKKREAFQKYGQDSRHAGNRNYGNAGEHRSRADDGGRETSYSPWDPYEILGIEKDASQEDIKQAFRKLAGRYHPDKVEYLGDEFRALAERRFKEIRRAYEELKRE